MSPAFGRSVLLPIDLHVHVDLVAAGTADEAEAALVVPVFKYAFFAGHV